MRERERFRIDIDIKLEIFKEKKSKALNEKNIEVCIIYRGLFFLNL